MRAWQPTATKYTAPMFQSIVLSYDDHHVCASSLFIISEISPLDKSCCRKEWQIHRVLVQPPHRQRWRQRHLFIKDNKFCFDNILFWRLLQRKRETNKKLERSFSKTNLDRLSLSWSFSKAELPRGCIWQKLKGSWWWRHRIVLKQSKVHNANSVFISLINLFMVQAKRNSRSFLDKTAWRTKNRGLNPEPKIDQQNGKQTNTLIYQVEQVITSFKEDDLELAVIITVPLEM